MYLSEDTNTYYQVSVKDLKTLAEDILKKGGNEKVYLLQGDLGSGKTTLVKFFCSSLGVNDGVTSPTFSIVNEYSGNGNPIYHFDFYRIEKEEEAFDLGCEEYFYSGHYCFIEWPEKIPSLLPSHFVEIHLEHKNDNLRTISLTVHDREEKIRV